jgi:hypothetical protein
MSNPLQARRGRLASASAALTLALATGVGSLLGATAPAEAQGAPAATAVPAWGNQLGHIKTKAANWITVRIRSLDAAIRTVQSMSFLGSDGTTMQDNTQADISGLEALDAKIQADTTVAEARADAADIFTQFRVYYLVLPVMDDVINVDHLANVVVPDLNQYISQLQAAENSSNQGVIGPLVAGMQQQVQVVLSNISGLSAQLLSYTPAQWNANHLLLDPARAAISTADRAAYQAEREYYEALRYLDHHPTTTTTTTTSTTSTTGSSTTTTTSPSVPQRVHVIQQRAARAIAARLGVLATAITVVQGKSYLGSDQATLVSNLQTDESGLQTLQVKIDSDTTVAAALADYETIFTGFRVYYLVLPVVNDVIRVDFVNNVAIPTVNQAISSLQAQVNSSNQGVLDPLISDMQDQVQVASAATSGLSAQLLAYTPAEWNADHGLLDNANANIATANRALATAGRDYARALAYLRHGLGGAHKRPLPRHRPLPLRHRPLPPRRDRH